MNRRVRPQPFRRNGVPTAAMPRPHASAVDGALPFDTLARPLAPSPAFALDFRTLLVPLDGSALAEHALPRALAIARRSGASIRLVLVHAPSASTDDPWEMYSRDLVAASDEQTILQNQAYLNGVVRRISRRDSVRVTTFLSEGQQIAEQLCLAARGADLVVMATHGRSRLGRLWHGSMADTLIRRMSLPLLLVRGYHAPVDLTADPVARKVLIPLDGSKRAEQVIAPASAISRISRAAVTLLHVHREGRPGAHLAQSDPADYMRQAATSINGQLRVVSTRVVRTNMPPATLVLSFAAKHDIDMIALTTRGRSGMARFARGGVADAVIEKSAMPVLVLGPSEQRNEYSATR